MKKTLYRRFILRLAPLVCFLLPACQQEMAMQPSGRPDEGSSFFSDERESRPSVPGTVARGHLRTDLHFFTGKRRRQPEAWQFALSFITGGNVFGGLAVAADAQANDVEEFPFPITHDVLERGRERYMIYCVVCHDPLGEGRGKIIERGYTQPPSYHIDRLRTAAVGHFFDVITNGYGSMPDYKQQIPPRDRWAVAAYIRALQLSQHFPAGDVTEEMRATNTKQDHAEGRP
jgi:mono/diheme cytochrome c family protein